VCIRVYGWGINHSKGLMGFLPLSRRVPRIFLVFLCMVILLLIFVIAALVYGVAAFVYGSSTC
jgi:hypothetical protein